WAGSTVRTPGHGARPWDRPSRVNRQQKEEYLRDYAILKAKGKPFFPYAVAKDAGMACVVMAVIITMSLVLGAELGSKPNPTTTTYVPRPEWYFFFLFEVLRVLKPSSLTPLATIGVPTIGMILLFLLPFYDRGPERRPERRPIATATGIAVIAAMAFLTYEGANAGSPTAIEAATPKKVLQAGGQTLSEYEAGKAAVAQSGCLACHKIGDNGNAGPGPNLTKIGARLERGAIARTLVNPTAPMPSFRNLPPKKFQTIVSFLSQLK
ncbi:MAG: c-type cytochrome, partial [Solirubrobacteraceae bacterium]